MYKRTSIYLLLVVSALFIACSDDDPEPVAPQAADDDTEAVVDEEPVTDERTDELFTFDEDDFGGDTLTETETADPDDDDLVENTSFSTTMTITYDGGTVTYDALPAGVTATIDGAAITIDATTDSNITYSLTGTTTNGMFKLYSDKKCSVELNNVSITNPTGPAINIQSKKRTFITLADASDNTLADGTTYADTNGEDAKGVIFSEGQLIFSGSGQLNITANAKAGISSDQYLRFRQGNILSVVAAEGNAVRAKDSLIISGGEMTVDVSGQGNKGLKSDGPIRINGGRTIIINSADAYYDADDDDTKGPAGVNSDGDMTITGGELFVKATGTGGKGITADGTLTITDGTIRVITTGEKFVYSSGGTGGGMGNMGGAGGGNNNTGRFFATTPGPGGMIDDGSSDYNKSAKGIRSEGNMTIAGGDIMCRTTGGEGSEAIESKALMTITGGTIQGYAYDDTFNSGSHMYLQGGTIVAISTNNDGLDANGSMYISGGDIVAIGLGEDGVDVVEGGTLNLTGGTLLSLGNTCMTTPSRSSSQQYLLVNNVSGLSSGSTLSLADNALGRTIYSYTMPVAFNRGTLILSMPELYKGNTYTLTLGTKTQTVSP